MRFIKGFVDFIRESFIKQPENTQPGGKKRIVFIDLAKGVCIILVVLLHSGYLMDVPALKALRMPLYFILSGLFFKDYGGVLNLIVKKTNKLLIPFWSFVIIYLLISIVTSPRAAFLPKVVDDILQPFTEPSVNNLPIWFLLCLFWVNLIYCIINRNVGNIWLRAALILVIGCGVGYYVSVHNIYLPLFFASALSATPFFFIGVCLRKLPVLYKTEHDRFYLLAFVLAAVAAVTYCVLNGTPFIDFRSNVYQGNIVEIYLVAVVLVIALLLICKAVEWLPLVSYIGRYSVIVLCCHAIFIDYAYLPYYFCVGRDVTALESVVISWILCWLCIPVLKTFVPYITAQKDLITYTPSDSGRIGSKQFRKA